MNIGNKALFVSLSLSEIIHFLYHITAVADVSQYHLHLPLPLSYGSYYTCHRITCGHDLPHLA